MSDEEQRLALWISKEQAQWLINDIGVAMTEGIGGHPCTDILVEQMVNYFQLEEPWWLKDGLRTYS